MTKNECEKKIISLKEKLIDKTLEVKALEEELSAVNRTKELYKDIIKRHGYDKKSLGNKKIVEEIVETWNTLWADKLAVKIRPTKAVVERVTERLINFTKEDILTALTTRHDFVRQNDWHNIPKNEHHMTNIMLVLDSDESLLKALNLRVPTDQINMKKQTRKFEKDVHDKTLLE